MKKKTYSTPWATVVCPQGGHLMQFITTSGSHVDNLGDKDPASRRFRNSLWDDDEEL